MGRSRQIPDTRSLRWNRDDTAAHGALLAPQRENAKDGQPARQDPSWSDVLPRSGMPGTRNPTASSDGCLASCSLALDATKPVVLTPKGRRPGLEYCDYPRGRTLLKQ